ncbi:hypothetical protein Hanom_Chr14g01262831 [Helianthus anomalus]
MRLIFSSMWCYKLEVRPNERICSINLRIFISNTGMLITLIVNISRRNARVSVNSLNKQIETHVCETHE